jgi:hypothetical protein
MNDYNTSRDAYEGNIDLYNVILHTMIKHHRVP